MKRRHLLRAMLGIQLGLLTSSFNGTGPEMSPQMKTFYEQLNPDARKKFDQLDEEHKKRALGIVDQYCKAVQECKGHREESVERQYHHQMQQKRTQATQ